MFTYLPCHRFALQVTKEARQAHDLGINVFVVGVGVKNEREINSIVSPPTDETKFLVDDVADLAFLPDVVFAQMCISESFHRTVYVYVRVVLWSVVVCVCVGVSQSVACSSLCVCQ